MAIDLVEAMVQADDPANKFTVGRNFTRSIRNMLFCTTPNAQWSADRNLKNVAYPLGTLSGTINRNKFRLQVGDNFRWTCARLGISEMVFRVRKITEENLIKETIKIDAIEDVEYMSGAASYTNITIPVGNQPSPGRGSMSTLTEIVFVEAPYTISENEIQLIPLVARETGQEQGFVVYMSLTGDTYSRLDQMNTWAIRGVLENTYPDDTYEIDDVVGFQVSIPDYASQLSSISRVQLFGPTNLSLLGSDSEGEIITWQTITPVSGDIYEITGVYRNRYGSPRLLHPPGTEFWFINQHYTVLENTEFTYGNTLYFKVVPFSGDIVFSLAESNAVSITLDGLARRPYDPTNFCCNDECVTPTYTQHCTLTWSPRVRGDGLGLGNPDYEIENPSHEGYFEIEVYVNDVLVRTASAIDTDTWTYFSSWNGDDNGALADEIVFKLRNYLTYNGVEYTSDWVTLTVNKE